MTDYRVSLTTGADSEDFSSSWWRRWFLSPKSSYWLKIHATDFHAWSSRITTLDKNTSQLLRVTLIPNPIDLEKNMANCDGCGSQWDNDRTAPKPVLLGWSPTIMTAAGVWSAVAPGTTDRGCLRSALRYRWARLQKASPWGFVSPRVSWISKRSSEPFSQRTPS